MESGAQERSGAATFDAVFETPSLGAIVRHRRTLRRSSAIVMYADPRRQRLQLMAARWLCRLVVGRAPRLQRVTPWALFETNPEAVSVLESHAEAFNQPLIGALASVVSASRADVLKYAKSVLVRRLACQAYVRDQVQSRHGADVVVVTDDDRFGVLSGHAHVLQNDGTSTLAWADGQTGSGLPRGSRASTGEASADEATPTTATTVACGPACPCRWHWNPG